MRLLLGQWAVAVALMGAACSGDEIGGDDAVDLPGDTRADDTGDGGAASWWVVQKDLPAAFLSVWGRAHDDLWLVGADTGDQTGPWVVRGTASGFARVDLRGVDPDGGHLWWVHGPDDAHVYMVGEAGRIFRYVRASGEVTRIDSGTDATLYGIWGASDAELWAVGGYVHPRSGPPTVVRVRDGAAEVVATLPADVGEQTTLFKVWGAAADDVWVVGEGGTVLRWDGATWRHEPIAGAPRLVTIHGAGPDDVVVVGGSSQALIYEHDGDGWRDRSPGPYSLLNGVRVAPGGAAFAAGILGQTFSREGGVWTRLRDVPVMKDWHATWIDPRGDVYVAGGNLLSARGFDAGAVLRLGPPRDDVPAGEILPLEVEPGPEVVAEVEPVEVAEVVEVVDVVDTSDVVEDADSAEVVDSLSGDTRPPDTSDTSDTSDIGDIADTAIDGVETTAGDTATDTASDTNDAVATADTDATGPDVWADPGLTLGTVDFEGTLTALVHGQDLEIVQGIQGGVHLEVALRYDYADVGDELETEITLQAWIDGAVAGSFLTTRYPTPKLSSGVYQTYVIPIILQGVSADPYIGVQARIAAIVTFPDATTRRASGYVNLVDHF